MQKKKTGQCHFIPKVYLKQWSKNKNENIQAFDKQKKEIIQNGININNKKFWDNDLYNYKFDMLTYVKRFPLIYDDFKKIIIEFTSKNEIEIYYKSKKFDIDNLNLGYLKDKDNIDFIKDNKIINIKEKNRIYNELKQKKSTLIEDRFNEIIEKNYMAIVKKIEDESENKNVITLEDLDMAMIYLIMETMLLRITSIPGASWITESRNKRENMLKKMYRYSNNYTVIGENNLNKLIDVSSRLQFIEDIYNILYVPSNSNFMINSLKYCGFDIYRINGEGEFYTSDVPCFTVKNNFEINNDNNGVYFPLSPKVMIVRKRGNNPNNNIVVHKVDKSKLTYLNYQVRFYANRYVIYKNSWEG